MELDIRSCGYICVCFPTRHESSAEVNVVDTLVVSTLVVASWDLVLLLNDHLVLLLHQGFSMGLFLEVVVTVANHHRILGFCLSLDGNGTSEYLLGGFWSGMEC